ncbi:hypothetical protein ABIC89_002393 [Variovorax boronicumulans]|uniref:phage protein NinX family protein n=1 Tax=Variovorax boronicumulans TaxID=436515 RepID=UPI003390938A
MKTADLSGVLLDYWVAKAEGYEPWAGATIPKGEFMWKAPRAISTDIGWVTHRFSQDWAHDGPIIERKRIALQWLEKTREWDARCDSASGSFTGYALATAPLVAAMRAYVTSEFGDEVPDPGDIRNE